MDDDLAFAHRLADMADGITAATFESREFTVRRKRDGTEVTDVDLQVERALRAAVAEHRPGDGFLGEEEGGDREAARRWRPSSSITGGPSS